MSDPQEPERIENQTGAQIGGPRSQWCQARGADGPRVCPVCCGQTLTEIRGKLQCGRCHTICETCCEGGRV